MSIFGKKLGSFANKVGQKLHFNDAKKFGTKAFQEVKSLSGNVVDTSKDLAKFSKEAYGNVKKVGTKAIQGLDKGLVVADKVVGGIQKGVKKASNIAGKLEGVPVIGEFAGLANSGLKQIGAGVNVGRKGIQGLEKSVRSVESLGDTIGNSKKAFKSGSDDRIAGGIKDIVSGVQRLHNPMKR